MTKNEIIEKVRALNLPANSYVVFGSCPMAVAGLRESSDIDIFASQEVMANFKKAGWTKADGRDETALTRDVFDVHDNWDFGLYNPKLEKLLETADVIDDVPFASLNEVKKWKTVMGRPKDQRDIELINSYLAK